jgi:hypothetical protein
MKCILRSLDFYDSIPGLKIDSRIKVRILPDATLNFPRCLCQSVTSGGAVVKKQDNVAGQLGASLYVS